MMYFKTKVYYLSLGYTPTREAIDRAKEVFKQSAEEARLNQDITDLEAEDYSS
jgi:hypothetical protein